MHQSNSSPGDGVHNGCEEDTPSLRINEEGIVDHDATAVLPIIKRFHRPYISGHATEEILLCDDVERLMEDENIVAIPPCRWRNGSKF
jgi:hypothetical protein